MKPLILLALPLRERNRKKRRKIEDKREKLMSLGEAVLVLTSHLTEEWSCYKQTLFLFVVTVFLYLLNSGFVSVD